ncbi:sporulation protein YunB [Bacillus hwajinpoensis]|jgi:sporulation protein YunB|uniref:Sporulation protein YunB n=1 Tax=Guptibacillus hwajinpoensis TaxID=208199 RepID=A0A845EQV5_9BACL|nr:MULTISPECIES: sporulation protein YunB [Bacillaceae]MYL61737.1 sporulation protein YunB [Pseudalkalibacillus hwajinpoensis]PFG14583.1 sporulation protein YunB [Bacillus sp. es.036]QHA93206.1 sporulation protein YunB [Bacillus sp. N1-1]
MLFRTRRKFFRKGPLPFRYVFVISFLLFIFMTVQGLWIVEKGIKPTLIEIARTETNRIATIAINEAINQKMAEEVDNYQDSLIKEVTDNEGKLVRVQINQRAVTQVLAQSTEKVQRFLKSVEDGTLDYWAEQNGVELEVDDQTSLDNGIIHYIPIGQAFDNTLLANMGPKVPVRFTAIGEVKSDYKSTIEPVGINNISVDIRVHIEVKVKIVIPFATDSDVVTTDIPVLLTIIPGEVPNFYNNGSEGGLPTPSIQIDDME